MEYDERQYYEVVLRNVPFRQAQALYRLLVDIDDGEEMHGMEGMSWNGLIAKNRTGIDQRTERTIEIRPMRPYRVLQTYRTGNPSGKDLQREDAHAS